MNRLKTLLMAAAVVTGSSALASALPNDHGYGDRDRSRYEDRDRGRDNERRLDRDDYRFRDRDDHRYFRGHDRRHFAPGDHRYFVGESRWINGYYWTWDGERWCRSNRGINIYLSF